MHPLLQALDRCTDETKLLSNALSTMGHEFEYNEGTCTIRFSLGRSCGKDYKLSVFISPDPLINPEIPKCVETALFCDDHMVFIDELGYDNVCRFSGSRASGSDVVRQIIEERDRVKSLM
jgi:hypothetical protein